MELVAFSFSLSLSLSFRRSDVTSEGTCQDSFSSSSFSSFADSFFLESIHKAEFINHPVGKKWREEKQNRVNFVALDQHVLTLVFFAPIRFERVKSNCEIASRKYQTLPIEYLSPTCIKSVVSPVLFLSFSLSLFIYKY